MKSQNPDAKPVKSKKLHKDTPRILKTKQPDISTRNPCAYIIIVNLIWHFNNDC